MFSKKREERTKRDPKNRNLAQYGLFEIPSDLSLNNNEDMDDDDEDFESELLALTNDQDVKPQRPARRKPTVPVPNLDKLITDSLRDIPSDEELSGDDDDPDLLNELSQITKSEPASQKEEQPTVQPTGHSKLDIVSVLEQRLEMYILAEQNAKKTGESHRARRFTRGIKTLKDLIKQANAGKVINQDDIPPEVSIGDGSKPAPDTKPPDGVVPVRTAPAIPEITPQEPEVSVQTQEVDAGKEEILNKLRSRRDEYKVAALKAKRAGDTQTAIKFIKIGKQFELVIKGVEEGRDVDLSNMPGQPEVGESSAEQPAPVSPQIKENEMQQSEEPMDEPSLIDPPTVLDGLMQRMAVYKQQQDSAQAEGNASKARRMGRIVKQYESAIKDHKNGKTVPLDELPNPPGFVPLVPVETKPEPASEKKNDEPAPPTPTVKPRTVTSHCDRLLATLLARQREFREAALRAKQKGELAQAKEWLRSARGFDRPIEAARCGLPVDMDSLPLAPHAHALLEETFDIVQAEECIEGDPGLLDVLGRLEEQLTTQLKMCLSTRDHHKALGDVAGMNRFENLALTVTKDLDVVRIAQRTGTQPPLFHYENKSFSVVKCCTDLNDNDLELNIIRGINYNCTNPKEIDTYVKFEFPYPQEEPTRDKTSTIKDTNNPEYNTSFTIQIQRTARPCLRVFKRQALKLEVYSKGGFFRGDTLLGTITIKLQPLETQCELHDSYDLMEGRKKVGGKLEVRMRVRNPLVSKQIEQLNEKWLVVDH